LCTETSLTVRKTAVDKFIKQINVDMGFGSSAYLLWVENSCQYENAESIMILMLVDSSVSLGFGTDFGFLLGMPS
jgi:hypothetical protein